MKKLKKKKFKEREGENLNRDLFKTGNFCTDLLRNLFFAIADTHFTYINVPILILSFRSHAPRDEVLLHLNKRK